MGRPDTGSEKSRILYARDAWNTLQTALMLWSKDSILSIAQSPGLGGFQWGNARLVGRTEFGGMGSYADDADIPFEELDARAHADTIRDASPSQQLETELKGQIVTSGEDDFGTWNVVTLRDACEWFRGEFTLAVRKMKIQRDKAAIPGRVGRFRAFMHWARALAKAETYLAWGIERLRQVCLTQQRRARGMQVIQTRREITAKYYEPFFFNGTHAIRLPRGRPALSEAQWIKRYRERQDAQRKTNRRRKVGLKPVTVPQTRHGRPQRDMETVLARPVSTKRSWPVFTYADTFDATSIMEEFRSELV